MNNPIRPIPFEEKYFAQTLSFLAKFSSGHPELSDRESFRWQRCKRYLTLFRNEIVGHMAVINHKFKFNDSAIEVGWGATLVLDETDFAMKTFAGTALLDQCMNDSSYTYAGVGIVPEIESSYRRRGYVVCRESVKLYARFFNAKTALKYYGKPGIYAIPIKIVNFIKPALRKNIRIDKLELIRKFDSNLDETWNLFLSSRYEFYGERTAEFLNYKISQPNKNYFEFVHKDSNGKIDGYIIYRKATNIIKDLTIIKVCDLVGSDAARSDLLSQAMDFAQKSNVDGIVSLGSKKDETLYIAHGLWLSRPLPIGIRPEYRGKMHITFFDSDLDNLW